LTTELRLPARLGDLGQVYPWLDSVAGDVDPDLLSRMHVVLEEAAVNAAMHGFPAGADGWIVLRIRRGGDVLELTIEDDGAAFDPTIAALPPTPLTLADAAIGGWGLRLLRKFCPDAVYQRLDGWNRLTLRFSVNKR
jgi:anti-sigma regulatory factor (Ser/Thr protein kinase)